MIVFVTFLWPKQKSQMALPAVPTPYGAQHVNILRNMLWRNYRLPHRFILLNSDHVPGHTHQDLLQAGLDPRIEVYPIYPKPDPADPHFGTYQDPACPFSPFNHPLEELKGCFKRLTLHTVPTAERLNLAENDLIAQIDLDCVILDDITPLFDPDAPGNRALFFPPDVLSAEQKVVKEPDLHPAPLMNPLPFKINNYNAPIYTQPPPGKTSGRYPAQEYNGALQFFKPKAMQILHDSLLRHPDPWKYIQEATERREVVGSDQAWITLFLRSRGLAPEKFTNTDGVYEFRQFKPESHALSLRDLRSSSLDTIVHNYYSTPAGPPRIVFFAGPSDPSLTRGSVPWVREAWQ